MKCMERLLFTAKYPRDLAPKAKVLRCRHPHPHGGEQGVAHHGGVAHFIGRWPMPGGGVNFGPYLVDDQQGGGIYGGINHRSGEAEPCASILLRAFEKGSKT